LILERGYERITVQDILDHLVGGLLREHCAHHVRTAVRPGQTAQARVLAVLWGPARPTEMTLTEPGEEKRILVEDVVYRGGCSDRGPAPAEGRRTKGPP
jgi:hypothetical protein